MSIKSVVPMPAAAEFAAEPGPPADARSHARHAARALPQVHSAFVPVLLGALALLLALGWQTYLLVSERQGLQAGHLSQQQTVDNAGKLRASLDGLAADTQRLADAGNASAALLVAELRKRGVTINTQAAAAAPAGAPPTANPAANPTARP